jgi:hypothetical protein
MTMKSNQWQKKAQGALLAGMSLLALGCGMGPADAGTWKVERIVKGAGLQDNWSYERRTLDSGGLRQWTENSVMLPSSQAKELSGMKWWMLTTLTMPPVQPNGHLPGAQAPLVSIGEGRILRTDRFQTLRDQLTLMGHPKQNSKHLILNNAFHGMCRCRRY